MIDFMKNEFEIILQGIEENPSIYSNNTTTRIANELQEYNSRRSSEINESSESIHHKMQLLDENYNRETQLLGENYGRKIQSLNYQYNSKLLQELHNNANSSKSNYDSRHAIPDYDWEYERYNNSLKDSEAKFNMEFKKYENELRELEQERCSIKHIMHECNQWKKHGFDINYIFKVQDDSNHTKEYTLLHFAANFGDINVTKLLLEGGAGVDIKDQNGNTSLHLSASNGYIDIVELLVKEGSDPNVVNKDGNTSLHLAAANGHIDIIELLVKEGSDLNVVNKDGNTSLHLAAANGHIDIIELLVKKGSDLNVVNKDGNTPLHSAFYNNCTKVVKYLIGKEPSMKEVVEHLVRCVVEDRAHTLLKGRTPLHLAAIYDCTEVAESLLKKWENPLLKDTNGKTPRELATDESLIQLFGEAEIKQQEYNATKWGLVSGGSIAVLGIAATTIFATVFTIGFLPIVGAVAAATTLALAVGGTTYMILKPSAKIERIECEETYICRT
ncbi:MULTISPECIES: ankyrin repeat domain-containing protein [unclassified Wolbachia]|uniref:ankyrin repeat domain-containing protein n=1 Tax=unclassified Wolbachia TaxID=2640676 RepID=UPI0002D24BAF|nr:MULTISPECIES: ankyrin repeat domain-containing protein [unclassified Wolbachia]AGJ99742.1 Ankyrin repeat domain protein [Wolbachia endosymbiont of Drosophila simulans wHa]